MPHLYIGTSGYTYKDWRGVFYPKGVAQKDWLPFYAQHFNAVEINATFYRFFPDSVYQHWREITPAEFRFVLKAPKVITHEKALLNAEQEIHQFLSGADHLQDKLAAILWQFPASLRKEALYKSFAQFLPTLPPTPKHVFEFRHTSWFGDDIYAHLNQFQAGIVINHSPRFPGEEVTTDRVMYVRFHGPGKLYDSAYTAKQLQTWAQKIKPHRKQDDIYLFFNNTARGQAIDNANELRERLKN